MSLLSERSYSQITVEEIAAQAGVTKGAFYYYFSDKEDVAKDLWHEIWEGLAADAQKALDPDADLPTNLQSAFRAMLDVLSNLGRARFFLGEAWTLPAVEVAGRNDQIAATSLVKTLLADAHSTGQSMPVDADAAAHVLVGAFAEAVLYILETGNTEPTLAVIDRVIDSLFPVGARSSNIRP